VRPTKIWTESTLHNCIALDIVLDAVLTFDENYTKRLFYCVRQLSRGVENAAVISIKTECEISTCITRKCIYTGAISCGILYHVVERIFVLLSS